MSLFLLGSAYSEDRFFKEEAYTGAAYLKLEGDGRYVRVHREHAGVLVVDRGAWKEGTESVLVLESDRLVKDVRSEHLLVDVSQPERLPDLRIRLQRLYDRCAPGEGIPTAELEAAGVTLSVPREIVSHQSLQGLLNAMDDFLLSQLRHVSRQRIATYRGITFLVSLDERIRAPVWDAQDIRDRIDAIEGRAPAMVFVEVGREVYEREVRKPYPFRFVDPRCMSQRRAR